MSLSDYPMISSQPNAMISERQHRIKLLPLFASKPITISIIPSPISSTISRKSTKKKMPGESKGIISGTTETLSRTVSGTTETVGGIVSNLGRTVGDAAEGMGQTVSGVTQSLGNTASNVGRNIREYISGEESSGEEEEEEKREVERIQKRGGE